MSPDLVSGVSKRYLVFATHPTGHCLGLAAGGAGGRPALSNQHRQPHSPRDGREDARRDLLVDQAGAHFVERSEALLLANWPAALAGDFKASAMCLRVLDEQARFYRLHDRPTSSITDAVRRSWFAYQQSVELLMVSRWRKRRSGVIALSSCWAVAAWAKSGALMTPPSTVSWR